MSLDTWINTWIIGPWLKTGQYTSLVHSASSPEGNNRNTDAASKGHGGNIKGRVKKLTALINSGKIVKGAHGVLR